VTILYDPVCNGAEHAPFNAALLATTLAAFPRDEVTFFSEAGHAESVQALLDPVSLASIDWRTLDVAPRACRGARARFPYEWRAVSEVLAHAAHAKAERIVACAVTHVGLAVLEGHLLARARRATVAVVHHSDLSARLGSRSTQLLVRYRAGGRLRHIVLGRSIQQAVARRLPDASSVYSVRHPYLFQDVADVDGTRHDPVRFGFLGLGSADKGFDRFCQLARGVSARFHDHAGRPQFELVGRLDAAYRDRAAALAAEGLTIGSSNGPMPRQLYEERVGALSYAVLPYRPEHMLASSGAVLDAFAYAKPCIAMRTPLFEEYFAAMGDIGYLCDDDDEMAAVVSAIADEQPRARYAAQRRNIIEGRRIFTPSRVAGELRQVLAR
jgi:glycosyltransferase involved in cell wall biosynthesis